MPTTYLLNKKETRTRKQWLIMTFLGQMGLPLIAFVLCLFSGNFPLAIKGTLILIFSTAFFYFAYYCAYKKHGTIYLAFNLVGIVFLVLQVLYEMREYHSLNIGEIILGLSICAFLAWEFILSFKLRKINKKLQIQVPISMDPLLLFPLFEAKNIEELDKNYVKLLQNWPIFEPTLSKVYTEKKVRLAAALET